MDAKVNTIKVGRAGEEICARYLTRLGYKVLFRNWYCRWGEIDIIAKINDEIVFVEVKTVTSTKYCNAVYLFNSNKRRKLLRTINYYLIKINVKNLKWKLDLVCVTKDYDRLWIEHYKNVLAL